MITRGLIWHVCMAILAWQLVTIDIQPAVASVNSNSDYGGHTLQNPGDIIITGQWKYYGRNDELVPAKQFLVGLFSDDDMNTALTYNWTDASGNFQLGPITNPGTRLRIKIITYVIYQPDYEIAVVLPNGTTWQDAQSYMYPPPNENGLGPYPDGSQSVGSVEVPQDEDRKRAWWIKKDLDDGLIFMLNYGAIGDYFVDWEWGYNFWPANSHFCPCIMPYYCPTIGHICLNSADADGSYGRDTVIHEMGHAIMWYAYKLNVPLDCSNYILGGCGNHQVPIAISDNCAWMEGWADFWSMAVQNHSSFNGYPIEDATWGTTGWGNGDTVEGRVAGTLWDIYDHSNEGFDIYYDGFSNIWDTLRHTTCNNFSEFYNAWKQRGHNSAMFTACAYQNTIIYDTVAIDQAVDTMGLTYTTGGFGNWFGEKFYYCNDGDAAQSPYINNNQAAYFSTSVT